jgi:hypothetical protein
MSSTSSGIHHVGALLRFPRLVVRWLVDRKHGVGSDGLTDAERKEYEARFWEVANAPIRKDARGRAEQEVQAGTRSVTLDPFSE